MLWGGRFSDKLNSVALEFSTSLHFDIRLFHQDVQGSIAQSEMLNKINIINDIELNDIKNGFEELTRLFESGKWNPDPNNFEDIHSAIESKMTDLIGEAAEKIHSGDRSDARSRAGSGCAGGAPFQPRWPRRR